jgi:hypothetical protein
MSVSLDIRQKLHLMIPEGSFVTRNWLLNQDINHHTIDNLVKSVQLEIVRKGIYKRPFTKLSWQGVVLALQTMYDLDVVVGGLTALELQGYAHYLPINKFSQIHLFSKRSLPNWIGTVVEGTNFVSHLQSDLQSRSHIQNGFHKVLKGNTFLFPWRDELPALEMSDPERAILELLVGVPNEISFENAEQILQGMTSLSPNKLNELLLVCDNIRVRRLFLWMAERQNHQWFKKLNLEDIFLGSGNRVLVKGGVLNKKYKITVPQEYE